jgi:hypothetical protein
MNLEVLYIPCVYKLVFWWLINILGMKFELYASRCTNKRRDSR